MNLTPAPAGLQFEFSELEQEVRDIESIAARLLDSSASLTLTSLRTQLEQIRFATIGSLHSWTIPSDHPVLTQWSDMYRHGGGKSTPKVRAAITSKWEISPVAGGGSRKTHCAIGGIASTRVYLWAQRDQGDESIGMWRFEIGNATSPGPFFHSQIQGDADTGNFPRFLSIPRLPALVATPAVALEFALSDLFHEAWEEQLERSGSNRAHWAAMHRRRFDRLLRWQAELLDNKAASPWLALKAGKPAPTLLL